MNKKAKKIKELKYRSEEQKDLIRFLIILIGVVAIVSVVYGVSRFFIKEDSNIFKDEVTAGKVNYELVSVGTMFNRNYEEYYVVAYEKEDTQAILYSALMNKYTNMPNSLKVFFCDLDNKFNKDYYIGETGESNPGAKSIDDLALGEYTLLKIKNGKIVKYIETIEETKKELGV